MKKPFFIFLVIFLTGCVGVPKGAAPINNFDAERYLGKWYEFARFDHSFERGLEQVTAEYTMRDDGGIKVVNRGYSPSKGKWQEATGVAYFVESPDTGHMKVSFFGPFYGSYVILDLDKEGYEYSLVSGPNKSFLWILSREPTLPKKVIKRLVDKADSLNFDTNKLLFINQTTSQ